MNDESETYAFTLSNGIEFLMLALFSFRVGRDQGLGKFILNFLSEKHRTF